jgi:hypothetical protein
MKLLKLFVLSIVVALSFFSCGKTEIDDQKPIIDLSLENSFPNNCDTLYLNENFNLSLLLKDNVELGSYSIDIHQNFDHHSHSTELTECQLDPVKTPINPFQFTQDFSIPAEQTEFLVNQTINIPLGNLLGDFDTGDYHFFISLTDKSGWSVQKGLSIKILKR